MLRKNANGSGYVKLVQTPKLHPWKVFYIYLVEGKKVLATMNY